MRIEDGRGRGYQAEVTDENKLYVMAVSEDLSHHTNLDEGETYSLMVGVTPAAASDCFLWIQNLDDKPLVLVGFWLWLEATEYIYIDLATTGVPGGAPTLIYPSNLNVGSGNVADGTFYQDPDITGLTSGREAYRIYHITLAESTYYTLAQHIVVPKNQVITFWVETGGTALHMTLDFFHHAPD